MTNIGVPKDIRVSKAGVYLMDLFALLFIVLALTGLRMWWRKNRRAN